MTCQYNGGNRGVTFSLNSLGLESYILNLSSIKLVRACVDIPRSAL